MQFTQTILFITLLTFLCLGEITTKQYIIPTLDDYGDTISIDTLPSFTLTGDVKNWKIEFIGTDIRFHPPSGDMSFDSIRIKDTNLDHGFTIKREHLYDAKILPQAERKMHIARIWAFIPEKGVTHECLSFIRKAQTITVSFYPRSEYKYKNKTDVTYDLSTFNSFLQSHLEKCERAPQYRRDILTPHQERGSWGSFSGPIRFNDGDESHSTIRTKEYRIPRINYLGDTGYKKLPSFTLFGNKEGWEIEFVGYDVRFHPPQQEISFDSIVIKNPDVGDTITFTRSQLADAAVLQEAQCALEETEFWAFVPNEVTVQAFREFLTKASEINVTFYTFAPPQKKNDEESVIKPSRLKTRLKALSASRDSNKTVVTYDLATFNSHLLPHIINCWEAVLPPYREQKFTQHKKRKPQDQYADLMHCYDTTWAVALLDAIEDDKVRTEMSEGDVVEISRLYKPNNISLSKGRNSKNSTEKIDAKSLGIRGNRSRSNVIRNIRQHFPSLVYVYNKHVKINPDIEETVAIKWSIDESGKVINTKVLTPTIDPTFDQTLMKTIKLWHFGDSSTPDDTTTVTYPFDFRE